MTVAVEDDHNAQDIRMELSPMGVEIELAGDALMHMGVEIELVDEVLMPIGADQAQAHPLPSSRPDVSHQGGLGPDTRDHQARPQVGQTYKRVINATKRRLHKNSTPEPQKKKDVCSSKHLRKTSRHSLLPLFGRPRTKKARNQPGCNDTFIDSEDAGVTGKSMVHTSKRSKIHQQQDAADDRDEDVVENDIPKQIVTNNARLAQGLEMNIKDVQSLMLSQLNSTSDSTILFRFDTRDYQWITPPNCSSFEYLSSILYEQCQILQNSISDCQGSAPLNTHKDQEVTVSPKDDSDAATCCSDSQVCAESVGKTRNRKLKLFPLRGRARGQNASEKSIARTLEKGRSTSLGSNRSLHSGSTASKKVFNPFGISLPSSRASSSRSSVSIRSIPLATPEPSFFGRMFDDATNLILPSDSLNPVYPGDRKGYRDEEGDELTEAMSMMSNEVDDVVGSIHSTAQEILSSDIEDVWLSRTVLRGIADSNKVSVDDLIESVCDKLDDLDSALFSLDEEKEPPTRRWFPKVHVRAAW